MTKPETKQHTTSEPGVQQDRFTRTNEVIHEMIGYAVNVKNYRQPFVLSIHKGDDPTGEQLFETPINKLDDGSFAWERNFQGKIEGENYLTCVLKSEENPTQVINWRVDLGMPVDQTVRLNTDTRAAAGR